MKPITIWRCKDKKKGIFRHNHMEGGHVVGDKPIPKFPNQKTWLNNEWESEFAWLNEKNIIVRKEM